ncbi:hypothetical protein [Hymenobacter metallilatus]|uniref:Uncharacterized protein n=1 Tax=Hymenobacter metallilatus TaxID=2493666 RepID=A0A3R9PCP8_9BACT|nr:hypothetical protein [Hymenobacter metallilatus]RSK33954.1 hypothetical protein EI290_09620 [Hymenobacter metallilatus]
MEDIRLFLNDQEVDLPKDVRRLLRMQKPGTDVASLDTRSAESSYTLALEYTRQNDRVFQHHRDPQTLDKFAPLVPYVARLYVGGNLFFRGIWQLTSIKGAYVGKLVSDEVDVFTSIGTKTLQELGFAPFVYRGRYGFDERLGLSCADTDVQFPFVAYGNFYQPGQVVDDRELTVPPSNRIGAPLEVDEYLPSVSFVRTLRQIFADVGWSIRGEVLEQADVREACLPFTGSEMPWNWGELLKARAEGGVPAVPFNFFDTGMFGQQIPLVADPGVTPPGYWALQPVATYNPAGRLRGADVGESGVFTDGRREAYRVRLDGGYRAKVRFLVSGLSGGPCQLQLVRLLAGQKVNEGKVLMSTYLAVGEHVLDTDTLSLNGLYLETGQCLLAVVYHAAPGSGFRLDYTAWSLEVEPREAWPTSLDVAKLLPALSQRDFVRGFVASRNLRFTTDALTRTLTFHYQERYELPPALAMDLSDRCNPEEGEYLPALPARRIVLGWADDESDALLQARKGFADYVYQPDRVPTGVEQEEQQLRLPWAPIVRREYLYQRAGLPDPVTGLPGVAGPVVRIHLPCMATADALATPLNEVSWNYSYAPRLLVYRGPAPVASQVLPFGFKPTGAYGLAEFPRSWWFGGSQGLYQRYYAGLFDELLHGHLLRLGVALTPGHYARLSPAVPVQLGGSLYRLARIPSFTVGGEGDTPLELLRRVPAAFGGGVPAPGAPGGGGGAEVHEFYQGEFSPEFD